jgi:hypothetical protein
MLSHDLRALEAVRRSAELRPGRGDVAPEPRKDVQTPANFFQVAGYMDGIKQMSSSDG